MKQAVIFFLVGGYFPLKAEGHAVHVGEKSPQSFKKGQPDAVQITTKVSSSSRPSSSHRTDAASSLRLNLSRPSSACSHSSSRLGSSHSRTSYRPRSRSKTREAVDGVFVVNDFSHYCFDDNVSIIFFHYLHLYNNAINNIANFPTFLFYIC